MGTRAKLLRIHEEKSAPPQAGGRRARAGGRALPVHDRRSAARGVLGGWPGRSRWPQRPRNPCVRACVRGEESMGGCTRTCCMTRPCIATCGRALTFQYWRVFLPGRCRAQEGARCAPGGGGRGFAGLARAGTAELSQGPAYHDEVCPARTLATARARSACPCMYVHATLAVSRPWREGE